MDVARRWFLTQVPLAALASPVVAGAQQAARMARVGYLGVEPAPSPYLEAFRDGLRRLGYVEGRNITIESRMAEGKRTGCLRWLVNWPA